MTREIPILFSAPMVRAILAGSKTQTRRAIRDQTLYRDDGTAWTGFMGWQPLDWALANPGACGKGCLPRWRVADHLWVRETWAYNPDHPSIPEFACFRADPGHEHDGLKWRPSIHMPRRASRITLEVTDVRVERLQDISEADAHDEGVIACDGLLDEVQLCAFAREMEMPATEARVWYRSLWESINGAGSWQANPRIVALKFRRLGAADAS